MQYYTEKNKLIKQNISIYHLIFFSTFITISNSAISYIFRTFHSIEDRTVRAGVQYNVGSRAVG